MKMLGKTCVLGAILVVLVSSGCVSSVENLDDLLLVKLADVTVNSVGELNVNPTDNLNTSNINYAGAVTDTVFLTPPADFAVEVHGISITTNSKVVDVIVEFEGGKPIFILYTSNAQSSASTIMHLDGEINESVNVTAGAGTFISITWHPSGDVK